MSRDSVYEKVLQTCLVGELRVVNSGLPRKRKSLSILLREKCPCVECNDGSVHLFKRKELDYLAALTNEDEQEALLLPILLELEEGQSIVIITGKGKVEEKIISEIVGMPLAVEECKLRVYRPQLALIRKELKTATQYVFSSKIAT